MGLSSNDRSILYHRLLVTIDEFAADHACDLIDLEGVLGLLGKYIYERERETQKHEAAAAANPPPTRETPGEFLPPGTWTPEPPPTDAT